MNMSSIDISSVNDTSSIRETAEPSQATVSNPRCGSRGLIIAISGGIGAGKTTLGQLISKEIGAVFYQEPVNPPLLKQFLDDQVKYAYAFQLYMLTRRQLNYALAVENQKNAIHTVIDRTLRCDKVFADLQNNAAHISDDELKVYYSVYDDFMQFKPDVVLHLDVRADVAMARITERARDGESTYTMEYLQMLIDEYDTAVSELERDGVRVCRIEWNAHVDLSSSTQVKEAISNVIGLIFPTEML